MRIQKPVSFWPELLLCCGLGLLTTAWTYSPRQPAKEEPPKQGLSPEGHLLLRWSLIYIPWGLAALMAADALTPLIRRSLHVATAPRAEAPAKSDSDTASVDGDAPTQRRKARRRPKPCPSPSWTSDSDSGRGA